MGFLFIFKIHGDDLYVDGLFTSRGPYDVLRVSKKWDFGSWKTCFSYIDSKPRLKILQNELNEIIISGLLIQNAWFPDKFLF